MAKYVLRALTLIVAGFFTPMTYGPLPGIKGNEEADKAAKEGANSVDISHQVDIPWAVKKNKIKEYSHNFWSNRWKNLQGHRQTKLFLLTPDPNKSRGILQLSRGYMTMFV